MMAEKTYIRNGEEFMVEEYGRREFASIVGQCIEDARWANDCDMPYEDTIFVQYKDGSTFSYYDAFGFEGRFLKTNIAFGVISNSCTQQVTGSYDVDENGIAQPC